MNFIEAVAALNEGRCIGIKRAVDSRFILFRDNLFYDISISVNDLLAEDWELVEPVKQYEEVKVERLLVIFPNGSEIIIDKKLKSQYPDACMFVELTGTTKVEVKPKVKHREELMINDFKYPENARFFTEWEE